MGNNEIIRNFKGAWIPAKLYLDKNLSWTEKILLIEIDSLDNGQGCYASDDYLSKFIGVSKDRLKHILINLKKKNYIKTIKRDGRRRWLKSLVSIGVENDTSQVSKTTLPILYKRIIDEKKASSEKKDKGKPFYKFGGKFLPLRFSQNRWWVIPEDGGDWLEFAGKDKDIIYR